MKQSFKSVVRITAPVGMGYLPTSFAFGVLATQAGLPAHMIMAMSACIFAGGLQFAVIPLMVAGSGLATIALTTFLINFRHVLYAAPLIDHLPQRLLSKAYVVMTLTDENYSILTTLPPTERRQLATRISILNHAYWIMGSAMGIGLGAEAGRWIPNLDFALPSLFTILAIEQYLTQRRWQPALLGVIAYFIARTVIPNYALIAALAIGLGFLLYSGKEAATHDLQQAS